MRLSVNNSKFQKKSVAVNARLLPIFEFLHLRGSVLNEKALDFSYQSVAYPSRKAAIRFLQESCRSETYQTLSARILQVSYVSDKLVRFCQI